MYFHWIEFIFIILVSNTYSFQRFNHLPLQYKHSTTVLHVVPIHKTRTINNASEINTNLIIATNNKEMFSVSDEFDEIKSIFLDNTLTDKEKEIKYKQYKAYKKQQELLIKQQIKAITPKRKPRKYYGDLRRKWDFGIDYLQDLILRHNENWELIGNMTYTIPTVVQRAYMDHINSYWITPWTEEEDERLLLLHSENQRLLTPAEYLYNKQTNKPISVINNSDNNNLSNTTSIESSQFIFFSGWRNISYHMHRTSVDCRHRLLLLKYKIDLQYSTDYWHNWEIIQLVLMVNLRGPKLHEIARHLGRTSSQCYNCVHGLMYMSFKERLAEAGIIPASVDTTLDQKDSLESVGQSATTAAVPVAQQADPASEVAIITELLTTTPKDAPTFGPAKLPRRRRWSQVEDKKLLALVKVHGYRWKEISTYFTDRIAQVCHICILYNTNILVYGICAIVYMFLYTCI